MPELPKNTHFEKMYHDEHDAKHLIVKGNDIVQHAHYSMSLADQKVLASLIRSIKPGQKSLTVRFSTRQFMQMLGMRHSGTTFAGIMHTLEHIGNDNFWILQPNGKYKMWFWLKNVTADPHGEGKGDFLVTFRPELRHYLFNKALKYKTIYRFSDIMLMKSRYSPRLYEIFRSNQSRQKYPSRGLNYSIKELKKSLNLMRRNKHTGKVQHDKAGNIKYKYPMFGDFNRRVLKPAEKEINLLSEYNIEIKPLRSGRRVTAVNVAMIKKTDKQLTRRGDVIYCITHHIPKAEWKYWREDKIKGRYHKIDSHGKIVPGHYRVVKPYKDTHEENNKKLRNYFDKHHIPMKVINMKGDELEYYSPFAHKYIWTRVDEYKEQDQVYQAQKKMTNKYKNN